MTEVKIMCQLQYLIRDISFLRRVHIGMSKCHYFFIFNSPGGILHVSPCGYAGSNLKGVDYKTNT